MGIPKYLENKIKSIIQCCISAIQAAITPNSPTFLISRPNQEPFILTVEDQAIVGMADYANAGTPVLTGRQYGGIDIYEARFEVSLTATGGTITLNTGIARIFEADMVFLDVSSGSQYFLNGTLGALCDATLVLTTAGNLQLTWTTVHTNDKVFAYVRYTLP
jgi:hypothetical protein